MSGLTEEQRAALTYLLPGEKVVVFTRRHWSIVAEPVASAVLALVVVIGISVSAPAQSIQRGVDLLWWAWFALVGRAAFRLWEWRRDHFVATDRRLLLIYGLFVRKIAMMPLQKVTDLSYHRGIWGRLLGYGTFVLESAGADQALRELRYVDRPDQTYRAIMAQIFARPGDEKYGEAEVVTILPDDTTGVGSLARLAGLARRHPPEALPALPEDDPPTQENPVIRDAYGGPLPDGRPVYSSGDREASSRRGEPSDG